eukprot:INCI18372.1.p1 GENE.INCI18372.1~~INCI18372.1.p1  ORF type:complete len:479 (-),score=134.54 INCI18372.1:259-1695(-)
MAETPAGEGDVTISTTNTNDDIEEVASPPAPAEDAHGAALKDLQEMVAALKAELDATKADNARLQQEVVQARRVSKSVSARSTPPRKAFTAPSEAAGEGGGSGSGKTKTRRVKAPSSRLYNPTKLQQKAEKLAKAREEAELAKCSFKPKTKAGAKAANTAKRGNSASHRLFQQAKRHQEKRRSLADQKDDLAVKECTFSPSLDERSVKIASVSAGTKEETFSRLSAPRTYKTKEMGMDDKDILECTFTPKLINPQRSVQKNQAATHDRLYAEAILRKSKREQIRKAKEEQERMQELDGCTFAPEVNVKAEYLNANSGSVVERLYTKDMEQRQTKMESLKREVSKECTFKPKVRKNAAYQTANGSVIERLYETARVQRDESHPIDAECTFSPQITSLASKIDRGDLPTHERLALEMSPSQKIALADMEDYYEDDEYYGDYYGEEEEYDEEMEEDEEGEMEEIDDYEEEEEEEEEELELP